MSKEKIADMSAVVLAGGFSRRFGHDKGLLWVANKPLIKHVVDIVSQVVEETIVVTSSQDRIKKYAPLLPGHVKFAVDICQTRSPLIGALTGFESAHGKFSLLLPFDTPLVSKEVVSLLFDLCQNKAAAIPRWPTGYIEPLHSVYHTKLALIAAKKAVVEEKFKVQSMIEKLQGVRYVSTLLIRS
jgi:molybdenum cofactor guanylyltransferase